MKVQVHIPMVSHGNSDGCPVYYYDVGDHDMPEDMRQWLPEGDCTILDDVGATAKQIEAKSKA